MQFFLCADNESYEMYYIDSTQQFDEIQYKDDMLYLHIMRK